MLINLKNIRRIDLFSAIYYPNIQIVNINIIKAALILWDRLEYISPFKGNQQYSDKKYMSEALEMITAEHVPTKAEKQLAHEGILELVSSQLPNEFLLRKCPPDYRYKIYPQKFLPETWDALQETELAAPYKQYGFTEWVTGRSIGLAMMSLLAEACAGSEFRTVTDKVAPYKIHSESIVGLHGGTYGQTIEDVEQLISISLKIIDPSQFNIKRILKFRKREEGSEGSSIRNLRHNYLNKIDSFVERLANTKGHEGSRAEIEREFEQELKDDLSNLKEALKLKVKDALLSKEVGVAILAPAGFVFPQIAVPASILGVGALVRKANNYRADRKAILGKHAMSWLFEMSRGRLKLY